MKKFIKFVPIILTATLFVGCINDSTSTSTVAPFTTSECNTFKGANNLTDAFLDSTINASCSTTITETPCEFIVNNYVNSTDSTITTECPNGKMVKVTRNIGIVVDPASSSIDNNGSSIDQTQSSSSSVDPIVQSSSAIGTSSSSATITPVPLVMKNYDVVMRNMLYHLRGFDLNVMDITKDTISFTTSSISWGVDTTSIGNISYKFDTKKDLSTYKTLSFKAHGEDTVTVCIMDADFGVWTGYTGVDSYGDSIELGAMTGGVCYRAKLKATDSTYTFDLNKQVTVRNQGQNYNSGYGDRNHLDQGTDALVQAYWADIRTRVSGIEVRADVVIQGYQAVPTTRYTNQVITDIKIQ